MIRLTVVRCLNTESSSFRAMSDTKNNLIPLLTWLATLLIALLLSGCGTTTASENPDLNDSSQAQSVPTDLDNYWYQGKAEVSSYELSQARYREEHPGDAVLVFVAEDFLTDKQVKNETYSSNASTKVLKANMLRKFTTGIYDYSIMTSVFSPANTQEFPHALKISMSAQDWCGQNYVQLNNRDRKYELQQYSYFEQEGDVMENISNSVWLEDEIWTRLRMDPYSLPTGSIEMLPSLATLRLLHMPNEALNATAVLGEYSGEEFSGAALQSYKISYEGSPRVLEIVFEAAAPFKIVGWKEASRGGLTTVARRKAEVMSPYWSKHDLRDSTLRKFLKL